MSASSPAFQFYPRHYLGSARVAMMTLEEEGAYCRALFYCWTNETIPSDPERLARMIGKGCSTTVATTVATMFTPDPSDSNSLRHDRLDEERAKQAAWSEKSRMGGLKSAENKRIAQDGTRVVEPPSNQTSTGPVQPKGNIPSTSTFPSTSPSTTQSQSSENTNTGACAPTRATRKPREKFSIPSLEEVKVYISERGSKVDAEKWLNHYTSNGWMVGKNPMKDWKSSVRYWEKSEFSEGGNAKPRQESFHNLTEEEAQREADAFNSIRRAPSEEVRRE